MELYRIGPRLEEVQRPLAPEDRALVLLTSQELERPPQQAGPEDVLRHTPSAREARGCRAEVRRACRCGTVVTPRHTRAGAPIAFGFLLTVDRLVLCDDSGAVSALVRRLAGRAGGRRAARGGCCASCWSCSWPGTPAIWRSWRISWASWRTRCSPAGWTGSPPLAPPCAGS